MAAATGGDFYFWAPGEFASSNLKIPIEHEEVLLSYSDVSSKLVFDIPVESDVQSLTVFAGVQRKDLAVLIRPDGSVVRQGAGVDLQSFQHMLIATITAPMPGNWRLELDGAGLSCVTARVRPSPRGPQMIDFDFVEKGGRPGHEGLLPIRGRPRRSESMMFELELAGAARDVQVEFVAKNGSVLSRAALTRGEGDHYTGKCTIPAVPFRAAVVGTDADGERFRRVERGLREPL